MSSLFHKKQSKIMPQNTDKEQDINPVITDNTVLAAVPYQCCPLCNGNGQTVADGFTSNVYQTCKVCNGAMIIPMHIVDWRFAVKA